MNIIRSRFELLLPLFPVLMAACAATSLRPGAERVIVTRQPAPAGCKFRGQVMGEQGGSFTGGWTSNKNLAQGAMNDMRNNALNLGANYVVLEESKAGNTGHVSGHGIFVSGSSQQTDVTQVGNAYACPPKLIGME
ncbi:MAG: DUF4156 domain-containing protein [Proteobacteria bacterium]|nr:DUF4156 domain-containing protein [Pseudomonadota bacterium]